MKKKRNLFWIFLTIMLCAALAGGLAGCSRDSGSAASGAASQAGRPEWNGTADAGSGYLTEADEESGESASLSEDTSVQAADTGRKLVKALTAVMETTEFDHLNDWIQDKVPAAGGYVESASVSGRETGAMTVRSASYVLRVPVSSLDSFMDALKPEGNLLHYTENVTDVTLDYTDTESHIAALEQEQETLMDMLAQSADLDTLLAVQDRLTEVRYQLENYESQLRLYDNDIEYGTVSLEIREVERETQVEDRSFAGRLSENLSANFHAVGRGLQEFALWFIGALPFWILLAAAGAASFGIYKGRKKWQRRKEKRNSDENAKKSL